MNWFANRGQIIQVVLASLAVLIGTIVAWPKLNEIGFFSDRAVLFYVLLLLVVMLIGQIVAFAARPKLTIIPTVRFYPNITYPLKLHLLVTNTERDPVAIDSVSFELADHLRLAPNAKRIPGTNKHRPRFLVWKFNNEGNKEDQYTDRCILEPGKEILAWVPIDPALGETALTAAVHAKTAGTWHYRCAWFSKRIITRDHKEKF